MQIFLKELTGKTSTYEVEPSTTVASFKVMVMDKTGIPIAQQFHIFADQQVGGYRCDEDDEKDQQTLASYGIKKECTAHMVLRLIGTQKECDQH
ncbi:viral Ubiquitin [Fulvia fulva]|uniref:Viral Ubiquitin n=1 Tax=Passalora fulva TaxID=5499 RepID=A0A9Q8UUT7_PASFU|nr:viral Ubiquitin [Fulvia fulva]KAK4616041.1 viral Ubiquitin [Fulvia fulva]KAK4617201.1 viral Ubiquitin [Fulvia fulva]UJO23112.1 viral Ubiquitin [Fulvia fulva]WPV19050.1 viral Ubiquitin [Fulvia fulva]WPV34110.1 viral Ubiquitin [Fulvia fulva]